MADELEREILAMESRLLDVKLTMEAEKVNWERANKLTRHGTHWKKAAKCPEPPTPPAIEKKQSKPSLSLLLKRPTNEWSNKEVVAWMEHLQFFEISRLAKAAAVTGAQLLASHLVLSDLHLRQLLRVTSVDATWKEFVREVASLHKHHNDTTKAQQNQEDNALPQIAPSIVQKRVKKSQPMVTCWICSKVCARPPKFKNTTFYCSVQCQERAQQSRIVVQSSDFPQNCSPNPPRRPVPKPPKQISSTTKPKTSLTALATGLLLTTQSLLPPSSNNPVIQSKPTGQIQLKHPTRGRSNQIQVDNQYTPRLAMYKLEPMAALTLSAIFLSSPKVLHLLLSYLSTSAWASLPQLNRAWHTAFSSDDSLWKFLVMLRWSDANGIEPLLVHEFQTRRPPSWRSSLASLTRKCNRWANDNVRILNNPETWTMAMMHSEYCADELKLIVKANTGAIVGVETSYKLIQALAPEMTTMDILHSIEKGEFILLTCRRLMLFHATRIPPFEQWPTFVHKPFLTLQIPPGCASQHVMRITRRKYKRLLTDMLDGLLKRAKSNKRKEAIEAIESLQK